MGRIGQIAVLEPTPEEAGVGAPVAGPDGIVDIPGVDLSGLRTPKPIYTPPRPPFAGQAPTLRLNKLSMERPEFQPLVGDLGVGGAPSRPVLSQLPSLAAPTPVVEQPQSAPPDSVVDPPRFTPSPVGAPSVTQMRAPIAKSVPQFGTPETDFETVLGPNEEAEFQAWKRGLAPDDSGYDYDYRGAWMAGETPDQIGHWTDKFKKPWHPKFSDQSIYAQYVPPETHGHWKGQVYDPPKKPYEKVQQEQQQQAERQQQDKHKQQQQAAKEAKRDEEKQAKEAKEAQKAQDDLLKEALATVGRVQSRLKGTPQGAQPEFRAARELDMGERVENALDMGIGDSLRQLFPGIANADPVLAAVDKTRRDVSERPLFKLTELFDRGEPRTVTEGLARGVAEVTEGFTSPEAIALVATMKLGPSVRAAMAGGFSANMAWNFVQQVPEAVKLWNSGRRPEAARVAVHSLASLALGVGGAYGIARGAAGRGSLAGRPAPHPQSPGFLQSEPPPPPPPKGLPGHGGFGTGPVIETRPTIGSRVRVAAAPFAQRMQQAGQTVREAVRGLRKPQTPEEVPIDQENKAGVPGEVGVGEEPVETGPVQGTGPEAAGAGGGVRQEEEVGPSQTRRGTVTVEDGKTILTAEPTGKRTEAGHQEARDYWFNEAVPHLQGRQTISADILRLIKDQTLRKFSDKNIPDILERMQKEGLIGPPDENGVHQVLTPEVAGAAAEPVTAVVAPSAAPAPVQQEVDPELAALVGEEEAREFQQQFQAPAATTAAPAATTAAAPQAPEKTTAETAAVAAAPVAETAAAPAETEQQRKDREELIALRKEAAEAAAKAKGKETTPAEAAAPEVAEKKSDDVLVSLFGEEGAKRFLTLRADPSREAKQELKQMVAQLNAKQIAQLLPIMEATPQAPKAAAVVPAAAGVVQKKAPGSRAVVPPLKGQPVQQQKPAEVEQKPAEVQKPAAPEKPKGVALTAEEQQSVLQPGQEAAPAETEILTPAQRAMRAIGKGGAAAKGAKNKGGRPTLAQQKQKLIDRFKANFTYLGRGQGGVDFFRSKSGDVYSRKSKDPLVLDEESGRPADLEYAASKASWNLTGAGTKLTKPGAEVAGDVAEDVPETGGRRGLKELGLAPVRTPGMISSWVYYPKTRAEAAVLDWLQRNANAKGVIDTRKADVYRDLERRGFNDAQIVEAFESLGAAKQRVVVRVGEPGSGLYQIARPIQKVSAVPAGKQLPASRLPQESPGPQPKGDFQEGVDVPVSTTATPQMPISNHEIDLKNPKPRDWTTIAERLWIKAFPSVDKGTGSNRIALNPVGSKLLQLLLGTNKLLNGVSLTNDAYVNALGNFDDLTKKGAPLEAHRDKVRKFLDTVFDSVDTSPSGAASVTVYQPQGDRTYGDKLSDRVGWAQDEAAAEAAGGPPATRDTLAQLGLKYARGVRYHEGQHGVQAWLERMGGEPNYSWLNNPLIQRAKQVLVDRFNYSDDPVSIHKEIGANLAQGRYKRFGWGDEEAVDAVLQYWNSYSGHKRSGLNTAEIFRDFDLKLKEAVFHRSPAVRADYEGMLARKAAGAAEQQAAQQQASQALAAHGATAKSPPNAGQRKTSPVMADQPERRPDKPPQALSKSEAEPLSSNFAKSEQDFLRNIPEKNRPDMARSLEQYKKENPPGNWKPFTGEQAAAEAQKLAGRLDEDLVKEVDLDHYRKESAAAGYLRIAAQQRWLTLNRERYQMEKDLAKLVAQSGENPDKAQKADMEGLEARIDDTSGYQSRLADYVLKMRSQTGRTLRDFRMSLEEQEDPFNPRIIEQRYRKAANMKRNAPIPPKAKKELDDLQAAGSEAVDNAKKKIRKAKAKDALAAAGKQVENDAKKEQPPPTLEQKMKRAKDLLLKELERHDPNWVEHPKDPAKWKFTPEEQELLNRDPEFIRIKRELAKRINDAHRTDAWDIARNWPKASVLTGLVHEIGHEMDTARRMKEGLETKPKEGSAYEKAHHLMGAVGSASAVRNILGTGSNVLLAEEFVARPFEALLDRILHKRYGIEKRQFGGISFQQYKNAFQKGFLERGMPMAQEIMRHGYTEEDLEKGETSRILRPRDDASLLQKELAKKINYTLQGLAAADRPFKEFARQRKLEELKGLGYGDDPELEAELEALADERAHTSTFNNRNDAVQWINKRKMALARGGKVAKVGSVIVEHVVPFVNTLANVVSTGLSYTPVGTAKAIYKTATWKNPQKEQAKREADREREAKEEGKEFTDSERAIHKIQDEAHRRGADKQYREIIKNWARPIPGIAFIVLGGVLAANGMLSGSYKKRGKGRGQQNVLSSANIPPNSIYFGGRWHPLSDYTPFGTMFGMGADMYNAYTDIRDDPSLEGGWDVTKEYGKSLLDTLYQVFTGNPMAMAAEQVGETVTETERAGLGAAAESFFGKKIAMDIPTSWKTIGEMIDPHERDTAGGKEVGGAYTQPLNRIPFARQMLPIRKTMFGEKIEKDWLSLILPFVGSKDRGGMSDPLIQELRRTGASINTPKMRPEGWDEKTDKKIQAETQEAYDKRMAELGADLARTLKQRVASFDYRTAPRHRQRFFLEEAARRVNGRHEARK